MLTLIGTHKHTHGFRLIEGIAILRMTLSPQIERDAYRQPAAPVGRHGARTVTVCLLRLIAYTELGGESWNTYDSR